MTGNDTQAAETRRATLVTALAMSATGDRQAFSRVYDMTAAKLFGICLRICGERQAAEDVLQEVYLIVWRRAAGYRPERSHPVTWLATIARNRALDWRRSPRGRAFIPVPAGGPDETVDDAPRADQALVATEDGQRLDHCLDELDERPRHAIRSAFLDGLTYADVAARAGVPLPTMKSIIRRALLRLRECLNDDA
ncbi:RNA polymerase sigma-70 factor (ECF subfamily) [Sphingomonas endophytica]|uniref:RNA polymerase sigma factor n=1 Tax=Sphingomonas endophytica TaxID=869719 RepID=A0A7X0JGX6_9SPHN|nr:sigma-70 family RNA polymerase sigma factor [Sphingomonas endophytica]MBB6506411.1 RNA polymerase sigma-70 factor (ECF subfamily) [Sphingomonas endophytica]